MITAVKPSVVIWGASGHAKVVADIIRLQQQFVIAGHIDDINPQRKGELFFGTSILGDTGELESLRREGVRHAIVGFGDCKARLAAAARLEALGYLLVTAVHPSAVVAEDVEIGAGTVIAAGCVINPGTRLGKNVIINTLAGVDHDCMIEDGAHIGPGVHLAGTVKVGAATFVGIGSSVREKITIGANSVLGAGSVVVCDIPDNVMAWGVPSRVQKTS